MPCATVASMPPPAWKSWALAAAGALALTGGVAAWYRLTWGHRDTALPREDDTTTETDTGAETGAQEDNDPPPANDPPEPGTAETPPPALSGAPSAPPPPQPKGRISFSHAADPCSPVPTPDLPSDYPRVTVLGVTVAWPPGDAPLPEPTGFAYMVVGILEEAALLTGTPRRADTTVLVYGTNEQFHALSHAPSWADGLYSGAVHLPASAARDLGVKLATLRHELMHAQLHSAVGCMPLWFNEGLAMRFGGRPPRQEWMKMLRRHRAIDFGALEVSTIDDMGKPEVDLVYAQSLAMVLSVEERSPEDAIEEAVSDLAVRRPQREDALRLWRRVRPGFTTGDLLSSLASRIFGMPAGRALDSLFQEQAVCCSGTARIATLRCHGGTIRPGESTWVEEGHRPPAVCEVDPKVGP